MSQAVRDIAGAIERLSRERQVDVIVLIRGGGRAAECCIFIPGDSRRAARLAG